MDNNIVLTQQAPQSSPFDSIRHEDGRGEYWLARELQELLGYAKWQKFKAVVGQAQENVESIAEEALEHFLPVEVKSQGRPSLDYRLSRLAAYHVALACDARGNERVKAAKHYFAIKTREAEVVIPAQNDRLRELELELQLRQVDKELMECKNSLVTMHGAELALRIMGDKDVKVELTTACTEIVEPERNRSVKVLSAEQLKRAVREKTGQRLKSMASFTEALRDAGRDDLLVPVTRHQTLEYVRPETLEEAISVVFAEAHQRLLGESG